MGLQKALSGFQVLDFSRHMPGPFCTLLLADLGADIIKVESPRGGDPARSFAPATDYDADQSGFFEALNRNKRSLTLDLKSKHGRDAVYRLVDDVDLVVESFRPGVMERLELGSQRLRARNERLIYCSITGYGRTGPAKQKPGHDLNYLARTGLLDQIGPSPEAPPVIPGFQIADIAGGALYGALSLLAALLKRERTGEGSCLDISMAEGALSLFLPFLSFVDSGYEFERGEEILNGGRPVYNIFQTADGRYLSAAPLEPKFWVEFCETIGLETGSRNPFKGGDDARHLMKAIQRRIQTKTLAEWLQTFESVDVCVEPVQKPSEVLEDELFRARKVFFSLAGETHVRTPVTPDEVEHEPAPALGEHSSEILEEIGYGDERIDELREDGVI